MSDSDSPHGQRPAVTVSHDEDDGWVIDISGADADLSVKMGRDDGAFVLADFNSTGPSFERRDTPSYYAYWTEEP